MVVLGVGDFLASWRGSSLLFGRRTEVFPCPGSCVPDFSRRLCEMRHARVLDFTPAAVKPGALGGTGCAMRCVPVNWKSACIVVCQCGLLWTLVPRTAVAQPRDRGAAAHSRYRIAVPARRAQLRPLAGSYSNIRYLLRDLDQESRRQYKSALRSALFEHSVAAPTVGSVVSTVALVADVVAWMFMCAVGDLNDQLRLGFQISVPTLAVGTMVAWGLTGLVRRRRAKVRARFNRRFLQTFSASRRRIGQLSLGHSTSASR